MEIGKSEASFLETRESGPSPLSLIFSHFSFEVCRESLFFEKLNIWPLQKVKKIRKIEQIFSLKNVFFSSCFF